jgi:cystathionine beta-lyase/cystathionine gamma-synthase
VEKKSVPKKMDELCSHPPRLQVHQTPVVNPLYNAAVYRCESIAEAESLMQASDEFVYQRQGHPNAHVLAEQCRQLHGADAAIVTSSGMSALALAVVANLQQGDHLLISDRLYGRSTQLLQNEFARWGLLVTQADFGSPQAVAAACHSKTRMLIVETIANPLLEVVDLPALAEIAQRHAAKLLVDNTLATPAICRPIALGADLVVESVSKMMNGHSDLMLGLLCGRVAAWDRVNAACATWGFTSSPHDCWLASRGLATLHLRIERAAANALALAQFFARDNRICRVYYPGLPGSVDYLTAKAMFDLTQQQGDQSEQSLETPTESISKSNLKSAESVQADARAELQDIPTESANNKTMFGHMVSFQIDNPRRDPLLADQFISRLGEIGFYPSLGDICTTISHPLSTSHRHLSDRQQQDLGITRETIRVSVGIESSEFIINQFSKALDALDL